MFAQLLPIALIAYVVGIFLASLSVFYRSDVARGATSAVFVMAWLVHMAAIAQRWVAIGALPLTSQGEYLLALGGAVMTLHLVVWFGWKVHAAGLVLPPLALICCLAASRLMTAGEVAAHSSPRPLFLIHTTVSTLGMATLCVALTMSVIYLIHDRALKRRRTLKILARLPSLDRCDQIGFHALLLGFVLLSIGIGTGFVVNTAVYQQFFVFGVKQILPLAAWLVFAGVLAARSRLGVRGRKSAYLTITGVMLGLLTVVGMTI